jgi:hydroxyethylthiazole kinase
MISSMRAAITDLRQQKPLVLCLTNYVTMDFVANSLLALGAAPLMSVCDAELEELISIAHAVTLNIGTLDDAFIARCHTAISLAQRYQKPVILDPVGAGASKIRTHTARQFMQHANIVRGNASEMMALLDDETQSLGVETLNSTQQAKEHASTLAHQLNCTVVVSGAEDFIVHGQQQICLTFGSALMPLVTGMGCALTAIVAAFHAVTPDSFEAARLATVYVGLCGQLAETKAQKPSSFRSAFIDALYAADFEAMTPFL